MATGSRTGDAAGTTRGEVQARVTRVVGALLLCLGMALACYAGYLVWGTNVLGSRAAGEALQAASVALDRPAAAPVPAAAAQVVASPAEGPAEPTGRRGQEPPAVSYTHGDLVGIVHLPTLGAAVTVLEGIDADILDRGVLGHYPGTGAPGRVGNFAVAGHRTTHGSPLRDIERLAAGDPVIVETGAGWDVYRLDRHRIVAPDATDVLAAVPDRPGTAPSEGWMVLTSCHPKHSAAQRIIAYARLDRHVPRAEGPPPALRAVASQQG